MIAVVVLGSGRSARAGAEEIMACIHTRVTRDVIAVDESVSCAEAARVMAQFGIGCVGVRRGEKLLGIVTARDLLSSMAGWADAHRTAVSGAMRSDMPAVSAWASDVECARLMRCYRTGHLAVEDGGKLVGVISLLDLCDLVVEDRESDIQALESCLRGGRGRRRPRRATTLFSAGGLRGDRAA